jgi:hypothetical protein
MASAAFLVNVKPKIFSGGIWGPECLRLDDGPELISKEVDLWPYVHGAVLDFFRSGKLTDNAFMESFNSHPAIVFE